MFKITLTVIIMFLGAVPLFTSSEARAEEEQKATQIENMVVTESREETISDGIQDLVPTYMIEQPRISGSLIDTLADKPGIQLKQSAFSTPEGGKLRLRGFDETRLKILKDGLPINRDGSYGNGPVDWRILSGDDVERIEIYRGAGPAKFGDTLGGVINIITHKPEETPKTTVSTSYGSLSTWDSKAYHSWKRGPLGWSLSASHFETDGYLRNSFSDRNNFNGNISLDLPFEVQLGAGIFYSESQAGCPVYNRPDSPYFKSGDPTTDEKEIGGPYISSRLINGQTAWGDDTKAEDDNLAVSAFAVKEFSSGHLRTDFRLWNQERHEVFYAAEDNDKKIYERTSQAEDNNLFWQADGTLELRKHHLAAGGQMKRYGWGEQNVDYIDESYFNGSINAMTFVKDGFKGQPDLLSYHALYLQDHWQFHPKLSLLAGLRQEWFHADSVDPDAFGFEWETAVQEMDEAHLDPRVIIIAHPIKESRITAGIAVAHRYPTSPEYFWWYLNNSTDFFNTDLHSEKALQYELGIEQTLKSRYQLGIHGYYYDVEDYISENVIPGVGQIKYNIGQAEIKGIEISFAADLPHNIKPWANATLQEGKKEDDPWDTDNQLTGILPDFPKVMFNAGIDYHLRDLLKLNLHLNHVGERKHLRGGLIRTLDAYTLIGFSAAYRIWKTPRTRWELLLTGENLFDETYQQEEGYPMPGALLMGGLRLTL